MADDLNTMLTDGAAFDEDRDRLAGNVQDASIVDPAGSSENPGGNTGFGDATDNTITETAPESEPPAVAATQDIAEPETDVGGGSGGGPLLQPPTTLATEEPTIAQRGVAQGDPALQEIAAPVAAEEPAPEPPEPPAPPAPEPPAPVPPAPEPPPEEPNGPPTVAVLPLIPAAPIDGDTDPGNDDDNFNEALRSDPSILLPPGLVSEVGLEDGLSQFATTQGTIVIGDPDGIGDIATVLIAGQLFTLSQLLTIDPLNPTFQIPLEAGDGDTETEGVLTLQSFDPVTGVISFGFTLTSPVDNANPLGNPNIDQNSAFVPISVTVTDTAGQSASASGGIRIVDATPLAEADTDSVSEGGTLTKTALKGVLSNDIDGADGFAASTVVGVAVTGTPNGSGVGTAIVGTYGTLTLNADGSYTYVSNANAITGAETDAFVYTIADADGDLSTTTLTINLSDVTLAPDNDVVTVNEAALPGGSTPLSNAETAGGALAVAGAVSYALVGSDVGTYGSLTLNSNGTYSYTLDTAMNSGPFPGANTVNGVETFTYTATDANGNTVEGTITVNIIDDLPSILSKDSDSTVSVALPYNPSSTAVTASGLNLVTWNFGADGPASSSFFTLDNLSEGYTASPVTTGVDGKVSFSIFFQGTRFVDFNLDPASGGNDTITYYKLTGTSSPTVIGTTLSTPGGPAAVLVNLSTADVSVAVIGDNGTNSGGPNADSPNASSNGWGVGNQNLDGNETISFVFYDLGAIINSSTGAVTGTAESVQSFQFTATKYTGSGTNADIVVRVDYQGLTNELPFTLNNISENSVIRVDSTGIYVNGTLFAAAPLGASGILSVEVFNPGSGKGFNVEAPTIIAITDDIPDKSFSFDLVVMDGDGDVSSLNIVVNMDGNDLGGVTTVAVTPIALDLDGSGGIEYLTAGEGVTFDYGWGLVSTAWVGASDGLLVYDYNADERIAEAKEFVFTMWGTDPNVTTDLQALAAYFDGDAVGTKDGVLDANDLTWSSFGVWQDLNLDGIQDYGEFTYLADWGISSILLSYSASSDSYVAADGDVVVAGQAVVTYADGSTGLAEDATFYAAPAEIVISDPLSGASPSWEDATAEALSQDPAPPDDLVLDGEQLAAAEVVVLATELAVEAEVASVADLVEQYVGENAVTDESIAEYQQELVLTEVPALVDMAADPAAIESSVDALVALDEADAHLPGDVSDVIVTATDVVDDFSYIA